MSRLRATGRLFKEAFKGWNEDNASRMAAALAYYTVFSLAPLLVICIALAGLIFGQEAAQGQIVGQIGSVVGQQSAEAIQAMIAAARAPTSSIVATIVGVATLLFGATGVFGELQQSLNTIWGVKPKPGRGLVRFLKTRFVSFAMVLGTGFILLVALVVSAAVAALGSWLGSLLPLPEAVLHLLNAVLSVGLIAILFAMIFRVLPDVEIRWRDVLVGAFVTAALFTLGKLGIGLYLGKSSIGSSYGAAGALVMILVWVYYSAQLLFFGAELTKAWAHQHGSKIRPDADAMPITQEARAQQGLKTEREEEDLDDQHHVELHPPLH
jgi:membrane protein